RLHVDGNVVTLRMVTPDNGEAMEQIDAAAQGNEIEIRFNNELLASGLDAAGTDDVTIQTSEPGKLAMIRGVGQEDFTYLLMPLKS
ncbi:MAG: DNA polymerase III subunit beta, partial [Actinomycetota bacterium]